MDPATVASGADVSGVLDAPDESGAAADTGAGAGVEPVVATSELPELPPAHAAAAKASTTAQHVLDTHEAVRLLCIIGPQRRAPSAATYWTPVVHAPFSKNASLLDEQLVVYLPDQHLDLDRLEQFTDELGVHQDGSDRRRVTRIR
ncbi:MAG: hypothetical protein WD023_05240 [Ilumatobacteraceae bacterium]